MNGVAWYYLQKTVDNVMGFIDEKIDGIWKKVESIIIKRLIKK